MNKALISEIQNVFDTLLSELQAIPQRQLNMVPFEGSWTAGQVVEHVIKANTGIPRLMMGNTIPADRDPSENVAQTNKIFRDHTQKYKSPSMIEPTRMDNKISEEIASLEKIRGSITKIAETEDLMVICTDYQLPGFTLFTRLEWINFCLVHTERHTKQLQHISTVLKENSGNSINQ